MPVGTADARLGLSSTLVALAFLVGCPTGPGPVGPDRGPVDDRDAGSDPCAPNPCGEGSCVVDGEALEGFRCECQEGAHVGESGACTTDPCDPDPCDQGAGLVCSELDGAASCACHPDFFTEGQSGCEPIVVEAAFAPATGVDVVAAPVLGPLRVRVVDRYGRPRAGITLEVDGTMVITDVDGEAQMAGVPLDGSALLRIREPGALEVERRVRPGALGGTSLEIALTERGATQRIDASGGATLTEAGVRLSLPPGGLLAGPFDLYGGPLDVTLTPVPIGDVSAASFPRDPIADLPEGRARLVPYAYVDVELRSPAGDSVELAPFPGATLSVPLGEVAEPEGTALPLLSYREEIGAFVAESSCTVVGSGADKRCVGQVHHFSAWLIARPTTTACVHIVPDLQLGARYSLSSLQLDVARCFSVGGSYECVTSQSLRLEGFSFASILPANPPTFPLPSTCLLVGLEGPPGLRVSAAGVLEDALTETSVAFQYYDADVLAVDDLAAMGFGLTDMAPFEVDTSLLCRNEVACAQVQLSFFIDEFAQYLDEDGDRFFAAQDSAAFPLLDADCDDHAAWIHPDAYDRPCDGIDADCNDATDPYDALVPFDEDLDPYVWNEELCRAFPICALPSDEEAGNGFDENCDGAIADFDGDGFLAGALAAGGGGDCDDTDGSVNPGAAEVPGNATDEDCDGRMADHDDDGYLANEHLDLVAVTSLDYPDCDDLDARASPAGDVAEEASFAAFYEELPSGVVRRKPEMCLLFDEAGRPRQGFAAYLYDANCDGRTTDLDGDGQAVPGDPTLGPGTDLDCDDLDPRVFGERVFYPVDEPDGGFPPGAEADGGHLIVCEGDEVTPGDGGPSGDGGSDGGAALDAGDGGGGLDGGEPEGRACGFTVVECRSIDPSLIDNTVADCTIDYAALGLTWVGEPPAAAGVCAPLHGVETSCLPLLNTELHVCAYDGWPALFPPNPLGFGQPFGPCDFGGELADCPAGTLCGGPALWTDTYVATLEAALSDLGTPADLDATPDDLRGICFPACD